MLNSGPPAVLSQIDTEPNAVLTGCGRSSLSDASQPGDGQVNQGRASAVVRTGFERRITRIRITFPEPIRRGDDVRRLLLPAVAAMLALAGGVATAAPAGADVLPKVISLPDGFRPEGIATGPGATFYVGSLADGSIYRGSLLTGEGSVFVA